MNRFTVCIGLPLFLIVAYVLIANKPEPVVRETRIVVVEPPAAPPVRYVDAPRKSPAPKPVVAQGPRQRSIFDE